MKEFKYDVIQLIQAVRERRCLWDKNLEVYKDRVERRAAWEEVFKILQEGYDELTQEEKRLIGEHVLTKWTNVRDTFMKSLKPKIGRPKRKYLYYEHLKFLLEIYNEEYSNTEFNTDESQLYNIMKMETEAEAPISKDSEGSSRKRSKKSQNTTFSSVVNSQTYDKNIVEPYQSDNDLIDTEINNDPRIMNEDEAFFASLLPTVVKYSEDERLDFRIEVLSVMRKIKEKRKWSTERID